MSKSRSRRGNSLQAPLASSVERPGHQLRLMSDYMCVVPLWGAGGCLGNPAATLGVSAKLSDDLLAWQEHFEKHFHHDTGWDHHDQAVAYADEGRRLLARLRRELPSYDIQIDLWPVEAELLDDG